MITAWKKKFGPANASASSSRVGQTAIRTGGVMPINMELQKKFAHGVNFNMKVVIRGDRATGKTCLFRRLQGKPFDETYVPTDEIQVANILWNYRTSDHIVKVDVWDVCDASSRRKTKKSDGLKLDNNSQPSTSVDPDLMICDATFINVYKNCDGVLLIFDVTKLWTWRYVCRELDNITSTIPVLVLANKVDLNKQREVHEEEILAFLSSYKRKEPSNNRLKAPIRYTSASAKMAIGLKYIYNFLNIPFLFLQRAYLEKSLDANKHDIDLAQSELDSHDRSADSPSDAASTQLSLTEGNTTLNGVIQQKRSSISSVSGDENPVNMYEEDFDSNDECHKTLHSHVPKSLPMPQSEQMLTSFNEILKSTSVPEESSLCLDLEIRSDDKLPNDKTLEEKLDLWLGESETKTTFANKSVHVTRQLSSSSSSEIGHNPLVTRFYELSDNESDSQLRNHTSTSSTTGLSDAYLSRSANVSKHPSATAISATHKDLSLPLQTSSSIKSKKSKSRVKKKTKANEKFLKSKAPKDENTLNIFVEDRASSDVNNMDQYDPL